MILWENLFPSFLKSVDPSLHTNESARRVLRSNQLSDPSKLLCSNQSRRPMVASLVKDRGTWPSSSKRPSFKKKEFKDYPVLHPSPVERRKP